jgi:hypothetical protein
MIPAGPARRVTIGLVALVLAAQAVFPLHAAPIRGLTHAAALARAYDLVYDADFAGVEEELKRACGPAPPQACVVVGLAAQWWRIYFDIDNRAQDKVFLARLKAAIDGGELWVAREPERAEAWFYLGAAYGIRVQYHAQRFEFLAAARDGKRIKNALENALALDPGLYDANAGVGMYQYYADIAPAVLKILRWFLGLPGGDKVKGLEQMRRARDQGLLLRAEATYQICGTRTSPRRRSRCSPTCGPAIRTTRCSCSMRRRCRRSTARTAPRPWPCTARSWRAPGAGDCASP